MATYPTQIVVFLGRSMPGLGQKSKVHTYIRIMKDWSVGSPKIPLSKNLYNYISRYITKARYNIFRVKYTYA